MNTSHNQVLTLVSSVLCCGNLQDSRIEVLYKQQQHLHEHLTSARLSSSSATTAAAAARRTAASLAMQLEAVTAEKDSLRRALTAAVTEASGFAAWVEGHTSGSTWASGSAAVAAPGDDKNALLAAAAERVKKRDEGLLKWFESRAAMLISRHVDEHAAPTAAACNELGQAADGGMDTSGSEQQCQLMALTRELCGLKLVESQLLASCAAANARCDAANLRAQRLAAALEAATAAKLPGAEASNSGLCHQRQEDGGNMPEYDTVQAAAQAAAQEQDRYRLKDQLLQANQVP
jgi:hypothetical protein